MDNSLRDKVLEACDIVEVVAERVRLERKGREYVGLCPFHADHNPSMHVSPAKRIFKCWACGAGGDVIRFVELYDRVDFREALARLARRAGIEVRHDPAEAHARQQRGTLQATVAWARQYFQRNLRETPAGRSAHAYAHRRGLSDETVSTFEVGFAADAWDELLRAAQRAGLTSDALRQAGLLASNDQGRVYDRFRNRLIFPINDAAGRVIAFGGRTLGEDPAKYLNSPESPLFSKSRVLYGFDKARRPAEERGALIVVEGYMDAVLLHQYGFTHTVATLGTALTEAHARLLSPRIRTLYLCFDGDLAGVGAANRAVEVALHTSAEVKVVLLPDEQDPADCLLAGGAAAFEVCLKGALDALEFKWRQTLKTFGDGDRIGRQAAVEALLKFIAEATTAGGLSPLQQHLLVGRLSDLLGVPSGEVFELLTAARRALPRRATTERVDGDSAASVYEEQVRGLPGGLIVGVHAVLGLLLRDAHCWTWVNDSVATACAYSETWRRLYELLLEVHEELGEYSVDHVLSRCEDAAACELADRALSAVLGVTSMEEAFLAARARLAAELELHSARQDHAALRSSGGADAGAFAALQSRLRGYDAVLPAHARWQGHTAG